MVVFAQSDGSALWTVRVGESIRIRFVPVFLVLAEPIFSS